MADVVQPHPQDQPVSAKRRWVVHPWRLLPPLLVLVTVCWIWATRYEQLLANHWAYPALLTVVGLFCLYLVVMARPRRLPARVPYPDEPGA